jgi:hypothetical protein
MQTTIEFSKVKRDDRVRRDYKNVEELAASILRFGLIQPIVIDLEKLTLIAGETRMRAIEWIFKTGVKEDSHESIKQLYQTKELVLGIHFTDKLTESLAELTEMELEENIRRHALDWKEECAGIAKIHQINQRRELDQGAVWSQKRTAELLGVSRAKITYILLIAAELKNPKSPVQKATSVTDALQIITKQEADKVAERLAKSAAGRSVRQEVKLDESLRLPGQSDELDIDSFFTELDAPGQTELPLVTTGAESNAALSDETTLIDLRQIVFHTPIENAVGVWGAECCDGIITDWPYGIDMANLDQIEDIDRVAAEHDAVENQDNFEPWLHIMFHLLRPDSYAVIFNDPEHHAKVWEAAKRVGFKVQRWPLIWIKTHTCRNSAAQYNFTKNFEEAVVLRKGNASLQKTQASSYWLGSNTEVKRQLGGHPFVKPFELWQWVADAIVRQGGTICDPFSGVGSSTIGLLARGYHVLAGEKVDTHYHHQLSNVEQFYLKVLKGKVEFV